jgi:hypothetical protein
MRGWLRFMPWCFVVWLARRKCEAFNIQGRTYVRPFRDGPLLSKDDMPSRKKTDCKVSNAPF